MPFDMRVDGFQDLEFCQAKSVTDYEIGHEVGQEVDHESNNTVDHESNRQLDYGFPRKFDASLGP